MLEFLPYLHGLSSSSLPKPPPPPFFRRDDGDDRWNDWDDGDRFYATSSARRGLGFRPLQPNAFLQHPGSPPIPFRTWLTGFKGYIRLLEFDHAPLEEGINKTVLFQLLGAEGMRQFGNEPAAAHLEDNVYKTSIAFCDALETFSISL